MTITINRSELEDVMIGNAKLVDKFASGKGKLEGDPQLLMQLAATLVKFDPWFEVLPGTKARAELAAKEELLEDDAPLETRP